MAELKREIPSENTGLAAGNNLLINDVPKRSALVTNRDPNAFLALNWQWADSEARFTSRARRFPTPQPMTTHVFSPNDRREATGSRRNWRPNPANSCSRRCNGASAGGRGAATRMLTEPSTHKLSRNFRPNKRPSQL